MKRSIYMNFSVFLLMFMLFACTDDSESSSMSSSATQPATAPATIAAPEPTAIPKTEISLTNDLKKIKQNNVQSIVPDNIPVYMRDAWLCTNQSKKTFDDLTTGHDDKHECVVSVEYNADYALVSANGLPNHDFESGLGCCADEMDYEWKIPLKPMKSTEIEYAPTRGAVAVSVNGVPFFGPEEGPGGDAVALHFDYFVEDRQPIVLGLCGGHSAGTTFHYHYDGNCVHWHPNENQNWFDWIVDFLNHNEHSPVIGFAFDGYPIYGPFGFNETDEVQEMKSSYRLKSGKDGYGGIDDWEFVEGLGDLDQCNGIESKIPGMNKPFYHYHASKSSGSGEIGFPYFILCYSGYVEDSNFTQEGTQLRPPSGNPMRSNPGTRPPMPARK